MAIKGRSLDKDLLKKFQSFELTEEEETLTMLNEADVQEGVEECKISCIGKIFSAKEIPLKYLRMTMTKAWKTEEIKVVRLQAKKFQIFFKKEEDVARIVQMGPWYLDNSLIFLKRWERDNQPDEESFN